MAVCCFLLGLFVPNVGFHKAWSALYDYVDQKLLIPYFTDSDLVHHGLKSGNANVSNFLSLTKFHYNVIFPLCRLLVLFLHF